jgi:hypothetical protein
MKPHSADLNIGQKEIAGLASLDAVAGFVTTLGLRHLQSEGIDRGSDRIDR